MFGGDSKFQFQFVKMRRLVYHFPINNNFLSALTQVFYFLDVNNLNEKYLNYSPKKFRKLKININYIVWPVYVAKYTRNQTSVCPGFFLICCSNSNIFLRTIKKIYELI